MGLPQPHCYQFQKTLLFLQISLKVPELNLTGLNWIICPTPQPITADRKLEYVN